MKSQNPPILSLSPYLMTLVIPGGLEPPTFALGKRCSVQLNYGTNSCIRQDSNLRKIRLEGGGLSTRLRMHFRIKPQMEHEATVRISGYRLCLDLRVK